MKVFQNVNEPEDVGLPELFGNRRKSRDDIDVRLRIRVDADPPLDLLPASDVDLLRVNVLH